MGILQDVGYGAMLPQGPRDTVLKPFNKALSATELDEPVKFTMEKTGYKKGGFVRAADGVAKRGKTKGRLI